MTTTAHTTSNAIAAETITWSQMSKAGIDTDLVEKTRDCLAGATFGDQWVATSTDRKRRAYFGIAADPDNVVAEGVHKGWDLGWYDLGSDGIDDEEEFEEFSSNEYYEPSDVPRLLADVAEICPIAR